MKFIIRRIDEWPHENEVVEVQNLEELKEICEKLYDGDTYNDVKVQFAHGHDKYNVIHVM